MDEYEWLLGQDEPAVRAQALIALEGRSPNDTDVLAARAAALNRGCVRHVLEGLTAPRDRAALWDPKYSAPYHRLVALSEMGAPASDLRIQAALDACIEVQGNPDGGFGHRTVSHLCVTGNLTRVAILFGRGDDPRVANAIDWLVAAQRPDGGWNCFPEDTSGGTPD